MSSQDIVESPKKNEGEGKKYGAFQNEIYFQGMFLNKQVTVTTDPNKLEAQAKAAMNDKAYCYIGGGAGERATIDANRLAFRQWKVGTPLFKMSTTFLL